MKLVLLRRQLLARNSATVLGSPRRDRRIRSLRRRGVRDFLTLLRPRFPPLRMFRRYFLISNDGQVTITCGTAVHPSARQIIRVIQGIIHGASASPGQGFLGVLDASHVAVASPINSKRRGRPGFQGCLRIFPLIAFPPTQITQLAIEKTVVISLGTS